MSSQSKLTWGLCCELSSFHPVSFLVSSSVSVLSGAYPVQMGTVVSFLFPPKFDSADAFPIVTTYGSEKSFLLLHVNT